VHPCGDCRFFFGELLGCRLGKSPIVASRILFDTVSLFVADQVVNEGDELINIAALHSEIASNRTRVDAVQFAADNLTARYRQALLDVFLKAGVSEQAFDKDIQSLGCRRAAGFEDPWHDGAGGGCW